MSQNLLLASASPARRRLLEDAGIEFDVEPARVDEDSIKASLSAENVSARDQADALAEAKAVRVSARHPGAIVIGSDQILSFDGEIFSKPLDQADLASQLRELSGKKHELHTAVVVAEAGRPVWRHVGGVRLQMHELSEAYIEIYIARNWETVRNCVGGYMIEAEGIRLFRSIQGSVFDILGLPMPELLSYLINREVIEI